MGAKLPEKNSCSGCYLKWLLHKKATYISTKSAGGGCIWVTENELENMAHIYYYFEVQNWGCFLGIF